MSSVGSTATALPHSMSDRDVALEHAGSGASELSTSGAPCDREPITLRGNSNQSFAEIVARYRASDVCPDCGMTRVVINVAARHQVYKAERVSPKTHCACPGGPAFAGIGATLARNPIELVGASVAAVRPLYYDENNRIRTIDGETRGVIESIDERRAVRIRFEGHEQLYPCSAESVTTVVRVLSAWVKS